MDKKILLISAKAQEGKDSTAQIIKEELEKENKRVLILHYADYLKFICREYYGWNGMKDDAGRTLLQKLGTDQIRNINYNFHVEILESLINVIKDDFDYFIVSDCRFPNEIDYMKFQSSLKTISIRVERLNFVSPLTEEQQNHSSEIALDDWKFDYYIKSESGLDNLKKEVLIFLEKINEI